MKTIYINLLAQQKANEKNRLYDTLESARAVAKSYGDGYLVVRVHDIYYMDKFLGYGIVTSADDRLV